MIGVLHLLTLKNQKTLNKSFAKLYQASVALLGSQNRESIGNRLFIHCILVKKQGTGLGGDISISKVVEMQNVVPPKKRKLTKNQYFTEKASVRWRKEAYERK